MASEYKTTVLRAQELMPHIQVPNFPDELQKLLALFELHEIPDFKEVANLISLNPYLAAELVALANTPVFNPKLIAIRDLDAAIFRLGINNIKDYVLSINIKQHFFEQTLHGLNFHSQTIAIISAAVAKVIKHIQKSEAYFIGLIHDLGAFAIHQLDKNYGILLHSSQTKHQHRKQYEQDLYGTSHSALGYVLAKELNLPEDIAITLLLHHEQNIESIKSPVIRNNVAMIELAHLLSMKLSGSEAQWSHKQSQMFERCKQLLRVDEHAMSQIFQEIHYLNAA